MTRACMCVGGSWVICWQSRPPTPPPLRGPEPTSAFPRPCQPLHPHQHQWGTWPLSSCWVGVAVGGETTPGWKGCAPSLSQEACVSASPPVSDLLG